MGGALTKGAGLRNRTGPGSQKPGAGRRGQISKGRAWEGRASAPHPVLHCVLGRRGESRPPAEAERWRGGRGGLASPRIVPRVASGPQGRHGRTGARGPLHSTAAAAAATTLSNNEPQRESQRRRSLDAVTARLTNRRNAGRCF